MYKLYDWLSGKIPFNLESDTTFIDVGAHQGDFTENLFATGKFKNAYLFEPNSDHYTFLKNKFDQEKDIFLYPYALGNQIGEQKFNCSQDDATGSLLPYDAKYHHESAGKEVRYSSVNVTRLDDFYAENFPDANIGLIKIDTQGFDLEVLKGAEKILRTQKPWLVIEFIFLPFYTSQAPIDSIFNWLAACGYHLGGIFNDHYSSDHWLAFADGVFVPEGTVNKVLEPFYPKVLAEELLEENKHLKEVCDDRLAIINDLYRKAGSYLKVMGGI